MTEVNRVGSSASPVGLSGLTVLGASARAAAQSARRAGLRPFAADLFADTDLQVCCPSVRLSDYPDDFPEVLRRAPAGPWMYTGGLENHPRLIATLETLRPLYGNGARTLVRVRDPWQVVAALERQGLPSPALASDPDRLPADGTWLRKSWRSAGGLQVSVWQGGDRTAVCAEGERSAEHYFQQRIEGLSCSAVYVAAGGRARLIGVTEQLLAGHWAVARPGECSPARSDSFRYAGSIGPLDIDASLRDAFLRIGQVLAAEFQLLGLFGVDCIVAGGIPWPVEVNPRYTASMEIIERASGVPLIAWHVQACGQDRLPTAPQPVPAQFWGKAILFARRDLVIGEELADYVAAMPPAGPFPLLADIPAAGSRIAARQPILTAFALGESPEAVGRDLRSRLAETEAIVFRQSSAGATFS